MKKKRVAVWNIVQSVCIFLLLLPVAWVTIRDMRLFSDAMMLDTGVMKNLLPALAMLVVMESYQLYLGISLYKDKSTKSLRVGGVVYSIINSIALFPFGTLVGIYTLIYLCRSSHKKENRANTN